MPSNKTKNASSKKNQVSIIGLGPMGQAMARVFLKNDYSVTVWNRTAKKAEILANEGAIHAETVSDLLNASKVVILSLTDYNAMYDVLGRVGDKVLEDKVIVNLSSDTPEKTREAATWLADRKASFIAGGIMVPAELVGKKGAYILYSGSRIAFGAHQSTLQLIGKPDYLGEDPRLAQLFYQAQLHIFLTSLASYLHATALVGSAGVSAETFLPYAIETFDSLVAISGLKEAARHIHKEHYPGDAANVIMMGATANHIAGASHVAGIDSDLPKAVQSLYERAIAQGHGRDGWPSLFEVIKKPMS